MHTHHRPRGRAPAAVLPLCLCLAAACSDEPQPPAEQPFEIPLGASLPPLEYTMKLTFTEPPEVDDRPATVFGHMYIDVAADGQVTGAMSARDLNSSGMDDFAGRVEGTEIVVDSGSAPGAGLLLTELRIVLLDRDGDGTADGAEGEASGSWTYIIGGDIVRQHQLTAVLTAGPDTTATTAGLSGLGGYQVVLPYDDLFVGFQEPLREADVRDNLRILANGAAIPGELTLSAQAGMVNYAIFQPDGFLAFGTEVTTDLGDLKDPSGNALVASEDRETVVVDPGVLTDNAGFESGLGGWLALGEASTEGAFQGFAPVEGAAQAVVRAGSRLVTYLDVPAEATALDLSITALFEVAYASMGTVVVSLRLPGGESIAIFDAGDVADPLQPCAACTEFEGALGPLRPTLDLTPYRGQRVFLIVEVYATGPHAEDQNAALVDDIQIR